MTPIRKSVTVPLRPDAAFDLFTRDLWQWWPSPANTNAPKVRLDPKMGGRLTGTRPDGSRKTWGKVTTWKPGIAFGMEWHQGQPDNTATQLMVTFTPVDTGTRVDLTHGGFDKLGPAKSMILYQMATRWATVLGRCYVGQHHALIDG